MQLHSPDPDFAGSARARANFRLAALISLGFVALLWLVPLLGWGLDLQRFGIRPREWIGLPGILAAPLLHADFDHLLANSLPLVVLGTAVFHLYPRSAFRVLPAVYLGPGIAVWLLARGGNHVGASGIIYGLVSFVFVAGLIRYSWERDEGDEYAEESEGDGAEEYDPGDEGPVPVHQGHIRLPH
jgi:membrane associated rhomboid family serine protease